MIVDDEPLTRYALKKLISTTFEKNIEVVAEVDNGIDAVNVALDLQPDVIFMDIKMPGMSGIDASEKILQEYPDIHIVILTAYDHFDFIQRALEIGVEGYLLKPISKEVVAKKIKDIFRRIDLLNAKEKVRQVLSQNMDSVIELAERDFIDHIIGSVNNKELIQQSQEFLGYNIAYGYFICLTFNNDDNLAYNGALAKTRNRQKLELAIQKYLPFMTKYIQASPRGNCIILFIYDDASTIYNQYAESKMIGEHLQHKLKLVENIEIRVGISQPYQDTDDFHKAFKEAYKVVKKVGDGCLGHFKDLKYDLLEEYFAYPAKDVEEIKEKILLSAKDESITLTNNLVSDICLSQQNLSGIRSYLCQVYYDIRHLLLTKHVTKIDLHNQVAINIQSISLIEELQDYMMIELTNMIECGCNYFSSGNKSLTNTIYDYIHRHYKDNITLDELAIEIGKTSQYTSKIFKELFNVNFVEYVVSIRIEKAKELLTETQLKVKEISEEVGYEDANYFCRTFKKKTGMTPKDYRKL